MLRRRRGRCARTPRIMASRYRDAIGCVSGLSERAFKRQGNNVEHTVSWQWQQGESDSGETIADIPPPSVRYAATWRRSEYALGMDLRNRFSRSRSGPGEIALGSATILGVSAQWAINSHWHVKTSLTNGLARTYRTSATKHSPFDVGRAINVNIDWRP